MKYYNLHIDFEPSWETYNAITRLLGVVPKKHERHRLDKSDHPSDWWYQMVEDDDESPVDFINVFLDLLEPNLAALEALGVMRENILFWLFYEYEHQCAMAFLPREMERLGKSGIALNIDCIERRGQDSNKHPEGDPPQFPGVPEKG